MAKKNKEEQRFFGQMPLPNSRKRYRTVKKAWNGLNRRITTDSGSLSGMVGMSTKEYPYLVPSKVLKTAKIQGNSLWECSLSADDDGNVSCKEALGVFGFDDFLIVIYREITKSNKYIKLDYIKGKKTYTGIIRDENEETKQAGDGAAISEPNIDCDNRQRCVVQFIALNDVTEPLDSEVTKKLIIFPDKKTIDFNPTADDNNIIAVNALEQRRILFQYPSTEDIETKLDKKIAEATPDEFKAAVDSLLSAEGALSESEYLKDIEKADRRYIYQNTATLNCFEWYRDIEAEIAEWQWCIAPTYPNLDYAAVSQGRLFGVGGGKIFASGYNDYANWVFDTQDEYNESNAWYSTAQANTKADGEFTGITSYKGHVLAFKKDLTYEIYNTKNPFRVIDIYGDGTVDNRTVQEVNGNLFFVSGGAVHIYTGDTPKPVSYNLGIDVFKEEGDIDDIIVSGTDGRNYYLWISRWNNDDHTDREIIYVYDTYCGQWSILLDNTEKGIDFHPVGIASNKNGVYFLRSINTENGTVADRLLTTNDIEAYGSLLTFADVSDSDTWSFETDLMTNESYDIKHLKKVQLRAEADKGAAFTITAQYTDGKEEQAVYDYAANAKTDIVARFVLRKSAAYGVRLKFSGRGYVKFHNLELIYEDGGEVNVTL